jgi:hypothetical protein
MTEDHNSYELAGVLMRTPNPRQEAEFWSTLLKQPVTEIHNFGDGLASNTGVEVIIENGDDMPLFFGVGPQKPPTKMSSTEGWTGKSSVHICLATDDQSFAAQYVERLGGEVHVSADRGITMLVFTSPCGKIDGCLLDTESASDSSPNEWTPPVAWQRSIGEGHWVALYYLTIDAPDIHPNEDDAAITEYGHGINAEWWRRLIGGKVNPYEGDAKGSFPFYVPLEGSRSTGNWGHTVIFQRMQDGTQARPLDHSWVVPILTSDRDDEECESQIIGGSGTTSDPYGNEIAIWSMAVMKRMKTH